MTTQILKAISLKRIVGSYAAPEKGVTNWLVTIAGVITDAQTKMKDTGAHRVYSGDFIARSHIETPAKDGVPAEYRSGRSPELHVPQIAEDMLDDAGVGAPGTFANFVMRIGVQGDAKGRPQHVAEFLLAPVMSSPAEALAREHAPELIGEKKAEAAPATPPKSGGKK